MPSEGAETLASKAAWVCPVAAVKTPEPGVTVSQGSLWLELSCGSPWGR